MKNITTSYQAIEIIEELDGKHHTSTEELKAWAYLIKTRLVWSLQGSYGRAATELIRMGYITETGRVQWRYINASIDDAAERVGLA